MHPFRPEHERNGCFTTPASSKRRSPDQSAARRQGHAALLSTIKRLSGAHKTPTQASETMSDTQVIIQRLTEILEVDFSWHEECQETWESEGDVGWISGALAQADESDAVRAAARQEVVAEALDTVAMLFGWERPGED